MDGNTWRRYRWVVERGTEPPFFLEPDNPDSAPARIRGGGIRRAGVLHVHAGRRPVAGGSALTRRRVAPRRSGRPHPPARSVEKSTRNCARSIGCRSRRSSANYLYSPIVEAEFVEQNERALPYVDPELVLLAERWRTAGRLSLRDSRRPAEDAGPARLDADREDGGGGARAPLVRPGQRPGGPGASPGPFARIHAGHSRVDARAKRVAKHQQAIRADDSPLRAVRAAAGAGQRSEHRRSAPRAGPRARRRAGDRRGASTHQLCRARSTGGVGRRLSSTRPA